MKSGVSLTSRHVVDDPREGASHPKVLGSFARLASVRQALASG